MIEIKRMDQTHVSQIAELERICFSDPWSERSIGSELENGLSMWFVATEEETVLGYIGSQTVLDSSDVMNIAVHPDHRKKGVGEKLVLELVHYLKEKDIKSLLLEVRVSNTAAINLYKKLGFQEIGRRRNYYHNPKEDAYILRKELDL